MVMEYLQWCIQKTFQVGSLRHNLVQETRGAQPLSNRAACLKRPCISRQSWGKGGGCLRLRGEFRILFCLIACSCY